MKELIILLIVGVIALHFYKKNLREEKIDFLNRSAGNASGKWVLMTDEDLNTVYRFIGLLKQGIKPNDEIALLADSVLKKYDISLS